jgi:uncharacterized tellurite resistance protein B-like protein
MGIEGTLAAGVSSLLLTEELAQALFGAFLTVCRADGDVNTEEMNELNRVAEELMGRGAVNPEELLFSDVTPEQLAAVVVGHAASPYRETAISSTSLIGARFVQLAIRVALADGDVNQAEAAAIYRFAARLGIDSEALEQVEPALRFCAAPEPPDSVPRLRRLLEIRRRASDWEGALAVLQRLLELEKRPLRRCRYLTVMGVLCGNRLGAHDKALAFFKAATSEDPFADAPIAHAKRACEILGRRDEAAALEHNIHRLRRKQAERDLN